MWYEIIPVSVIVGSLLYFPQPFVYFTNKWGCNDHPHRRNIFYPRELGSYFRDERVSGVMNPYVIKDLTALPDAPVKPGTK